MFLGITNTPRNYAWGSYEALSSFLGYEPSGRPEAELWLGAHPLCPSRIVDTAQAEGHGTLDTWITANLDLALGEHRHSDELPFLMKILAAAEPLSVQVHPDAPQAQKGYDEETSRGTPVSSPDRTYKDPRHKPEIALALGGPFQALVGFRPLPETAQLVDELIAAMHDATEARQALLGLAEKLSGPPETVLRRLVSDFLSECRPAELLHAVVEAARRERDPGQQPPSRFPRELDTIVALAEHHPGDPGILIALLLNRTTLAEGEAIQVPPGDIHAYLEGTAVEVMAASDNVIRAGLTQKYIDHQELQRITTFRERQEPVSRPYALAPGVDLFVPATNDFQLALLSHGHQPDQAAPSQLELPGPAIALAVDGPTEIQGMQSRTTLKRGEAVFITPDEQHLQITGAGAAAVATTNPAALRRPVA